MTGLKKHRSIFETTTDSLLIVSIYSFSSKPEWHKQEIGNCPVVVKLSFGREMQSAVLDNRSVASFQ